MAANQTAHNIPEDFCEPQILLMEDEPSVALGLQMVLREEGYGVDWAQNGRTALDTLSHKGFDLVVADLRLPDMDGLDVIRQVKDERPETMVIVITGYATVPSAVEAMKIGAVDYLPKPFTENDFMQSVAKAFESQKDISADDYQEEQTGAGLPVIRKSEVVRTLRSAFAAQQAMLRSDGVARSGPQEPAPDRSDKGRSPAAPVGEHGRPAANHLPGSYDLNQHMIQNAVDGIIACDQNGRVSLINQRLKIMTGYRQDEIVGKMVLDQILSLGDARRFHDDLYSERYGGPKRLLLYEANLVTKDGDTLPVQLDATVLQRNGAELGLAVFFKDLRELRKLEQEWANLSRLLHQDKMMSLGRLAASVVHEINNPLAGILNYLRLMVRIVNRSAVVDGDRLEKFREYLTLVEGETDRCAKIVSNLLAFSRKSKQDFGRVRPEELLDKCVLLSHYKMALQNIRLDCAAESDLPAIWGDFNQLQQCLINLIFNAIDAMPEGGRLALSASFEGAQKRIVITVSDSGCGIPRESLDSIFEPFFSTKTEGRGLGLGLSTVAGIVKRHGGDIAVASSVGQGTTFTLKIPISCETSE